MANKIVKEKDAKPDAFEESIGQALIDLGTSGDLGSALRTLFITGAEEVDCPGGKKAIIIWVPFRLHKSFRKIQKRLIAELEKKFSGKHVVMVAQRRILPKPSRKNRRKQQSRPRSRTLTAVHESYLDDIVFPSEITGKRTRIRLDNSRIHKIFLEQKDRVVVEQKLDTFTTVYRKLTGKDIVFEFPVQVAE